MVTGGRPVATAAIRTGRALRWRLASVGGDKLGRCRSGRSGGCSRQAVMQRSCWPKSPESRPGAPSVSSSGVGIRTQIGNSIPPSTIGSSRATATSLTSNDWEVESALLRRARRRDLGGDPGTPELQRFAVLQHHGTATRLLDVTTDPMIALWFACSGAEHADAQGVLFAIEVASALQLDWEDDRPVDEIVDALGDEQLAAFWPRPVDVRIQVQRGAFVFGPQRDTRQNPRGTARLHIRRRGRRTLRPLQRRPRCRSSEVQGCRARAERYRAS